MPMEGDASSTYSGDEFVLANANSQEVISTLPKNSILVKPELRREKPSFTNLEKDVILKSK